MLGEVVNPGTFSLVRSMLIWETVLEAGGVTSDGNGKKILLIRKKGEQSDIITVDVDSVVKSGIFGPDMYVKKGDIIYVQPNTVANVQAYLDRFKNLLSPFVSLESAIIMAPQMIDALKGESSSDTGLSVGVGQ